MAVLLHHFWPGVQPAAVVPLGMMGVKLFFVLSGYLITGILLHGAAQTERGQQSRRNLLAGFYGRRAVRILPVYYLTLAVTAALDVGDVRASLGWHAVYASDVYVANLGHWPAVTGHFWSLAIEAQFYLVWPLLLLFAPPASRRGVVLATIGLTVAARALAVGWGMESHALGVLPLSSLDALAMGGLVAALQTDDPGDAAWRRRIGWSAVLVAAPLFVVLCVAHHADTAEGLRRVLWPLCLAVLFASAIGRVAVAPPRGLRRMLEWRPLVRLGQISYGVYVYHPFVAAAVLALFGLTDIADVSTALLCTALSIGLAEVSWRVLEAPLLARDARSRLARRPASPAMARVALAVDSRAPSSRVTPRPHAGAERADGTPAVSVR